MARAVLSEATHRKLKEFAFKRGRKIQTVVDEAVSHYIRQEKNLSKKSHEDKSQREQEVANV